MLRTILAVFLTSALVITMVGITVAQELPPVKVYKAPG